MPDTLDTSGGEWWESVIQVIPSVIDTIWGDEQTVPNPIFNQPATQPTPQTDNTPMYLVIGVMTVLIAVVLFMALKK